MDNIIDAIATDASPSEIANDLKDLIYQKAAKRVEELRPNASTALFDAEDEVDTEPQEEE
tara:strand:+ start:217 stop:396 length:180 start_codon:yes stop_codon:yes gene_type:complete